MKKILKPASLIRRKNRFVASVLIDQIEEDVYVPNTGRLSELAIPGTECLLTGSPGKYRYKILYIINNGFPVMIDSTLSNSLFAELLMAGKVPGLENCILIRREPVYGSHRFDYLVTDDENSCYVELKSCTMFFRNVASFPDAVSSRASEHIRKLSLTPGGRLIILILNDTAEVFVPNYHTDYEFYRTLKEYAVRISISALRISYSNDLDITALTPVPVHIPEVLQAGYFFMILCDNDSSFYLYISDYTDNVFVAAKKIKNNAETLHSFFGFNGSFRILKDFPVIGDAHPCETSAELLYNNGGRELVITGTGTGRAFHFNRNPLEHKWYHDHILELRFLQYTAASGC